jgi:hypothetical protein
MSSEISYVDLDRADASDIAEYRRKVDSNIEMFCEMFGDSGRGMCRKLANFEGDSENVDLMWRIGDITGLSDELVRMVNFSDGFLSSGLMDRLGCTAIGRAGVIGQTMDLYDVDLSVVREGGAVYVTFPPYLTLMGMNNKLAFCTNYLESEVRGGTPISQIRRSLLRKRVINEAIDYLEEVRGANSANFLLSDGHSIVDVEMTSEGCNVLIERYEEFGRFNAHTNHLVNEGIIEDMSCHRLTQAVDMLVDKRSMEEILDSEGISIPMDKSRGIGFGTIVKVVMDVRNGTFMYKDFRMNGYEMLGV